MTDRDRLIEMLENCVYEHIFTDDPYDGVEVYCDRIADELLANGVTMPLSDGGVNNGRN